MPRQERVRDGLTLDARGTTLIDPHARNPRSLMTVSNILRCAERITFATVGFLLSAVALTLAFRSLLIVRDLVLAPQAMTIPLTAQFLDLILLILMVAEIVYTVTLSLRGAVLSAQPFLIVGLIAVIRRVLVLTVQEVQKDGHPQTGLIGQNTVDLAVLTLIAMAFVFSIHLLQRRTSGEERASVASH